MECPDVCKDIVCQPGERLCGQDNVFVYECDPSGTTLIPCGSCAAAPIGGICFQGDCISLCNEEQKKSYLGCEFFAVDLDNARVWGGWDPFGNPEFLDAAGSQFAVVVSNPDAELSAFVSVTRGPVAGNPPGATCQEQEPDDNFVDATILPPKGIWTFNLPRRDVNATIKARLAYRVASNIPITVYQFNPLENVKVFSNDASVLMPTNALGTSYYVMTRGQTWDTLKGFVTVVGVTREPATVSIKVTARTLPGNGIDELSPGETLSGVVLEQYEVLNIETNAIGADLTGSLVTSDQPVAVFGGSEAANAPSTSLCDLETMTCQYDGRTPCACTELDPPGCSPHEKCRGFITCCADHLEQQLLPVTAWGTHYVAARSFPRGAEADVWRILAAHEETRVELSPALAQVPVLQPGEWFEFETTLDFVASGNKPFLMGQFLAAEHAPEPGRQAGDANTGDPAFILAVPTRQYRDSYVFLAPDKYAEDYVTITAHAGASVRLDGRDVSMDPLVGPSPIDDGTWVALRIPVSDGVHDLVCPQGCGVMVHGYDQYVSYGYPGGLNLHEDDPSRDY